MERLVLTSLDLEMNQPSGTIIQIGGVCADIVTGEILEELSIIVHTNETLHPFIIKLTGINQSQVDSGVSLVEAYKMLRDMHIRHKSLLNPMTWGGGDSEYLRTQLFKANTEEPLQWCFGRRWLDIKTLHQLNCMAKGIKIQAGLAKAMTRWGIAFKGTKHNALDDARNTFILARQILGFK